MKRKFVTLVCALGLITTGSPQCFASSTSGTIVVDVLIARPACFLATIFGGAVFVVSLPVAASSGSVHKAAHALVTKPAHATFKRPLGDFDDLGGEEWVF